MIIDVRQKISVFCSAIVIGLFPVAALIHLGIESATWRDALPIVSMIPIFYFALWLLTYQLSVVRRAGLSKIDQQSHTGRPVEDRLDELERLKRRDMVTPEEYATKRQEILKDL